MHSNQLQHLANELARGAIDLPTFLASVGEQPQFAGSDAAADVDLAKEATCEGATLDLDRARRCGFPEVVFGQGKSIETLRSIFRTLIERQVDVFATRVDAEHVALLVSEFPAARHNPIARTLRVPIDAAAATSPSKVQPKSRGHVAVITAGTSDLPVAEEARETLDWMGVSTLLIQDVGVAGPHRLAARVAEFQDADAVVVVAGMEGALPSVVGGYVPCPVIAVPTSVGYGASFGGLAALLGMLNSCAANVTVVNIDAGFKGGYIAGLIASRAAVARQ
jgi:NCAIR mutase (PurE)-related protein